MQKDNILSLEEIREEIKENIKTLDEIPGEPKEKIEVLEEIIQELESKIEVLEEVEDMTEDSEEPKEKIKSNKRGALMSILFSVLLAGRFIYAFLKEHSYLDLIFFFLFCLLLVASFLKLRKLIKEEKKTK